MSPNLQSGVDSDGGVSRAEQLAGTNWLETNVAYDLKAEYAHVSTNGPQITLSWLEPGMTVKEVIPAERFGPFLNPQTGPISRGATGVSVDANSQIWAGCYNSDTAVRIDPNAGPMVLITNVFTNSTGTVTNMVTNHVGLVDMMVDLGDGTGYPQPYNMHAHPYNYSDMTGFNERVVNPSYQPFKGYWMVINDSGNAGQLWNKVSWTATNAAPGSGCSIEVYVRAADERTDLGSATFVQATNNVPFPAIRGRYIEVRLSMMRDDPVKQPVLYDLTLYGISSGIMGDDFILGGQATEGEDAVFSTDLVGAEPMGYQWFRQYAWETNMAQVPGATNSYFTITDVDPWVGSYVDDNGVVHFTEVACLVTNGTGETLWLGPAYLDVVAPTDYIPAMGYPTNSGPATRYPITNHVFGLPTNFNSVSVTVTLWDLSHSRSADISILLVSPLRKQIVLMSDVGANHGVSDANLSFLEVAPQPVQPDPIPSDDTTAYGPSDYGHVEQMPREGADPPPIHAGAYSIDLDAVSQDDPNGDWKLYIYDRYNGANGHLSGSWQIEFKFQ